MQIQNASFFNQPKWQRGTAIGKNTSASLSEKSGESTESGLDAQCPHKVIIKTLKMKPDTEKLDTPALHLLDFLVLNLNTGQLDW